MLKLRALSALVFVPVLVALVWLGGWPLRASCLVLGQLMFLEYRRMLAPSAPRPTAHLTFALSLVIGMLATSAHGNWSASVTGIALGLLLALVMLAKPEPFADAVRDGAVLAVGALYCGGLIAFLFVLRDATYGRGLAFIALLCTWASDTGAYFVGKVWGRHRLYPAVSPGKSVEGAIAGVACSIGAAIGTSALFSLPWGYGHAIGMGVVVGVMGIAGDLFESLLKRAAGVKDSSNLIPGHGGVLDRFDAVMFAAPALYLYLAAIR